MSKIAKSTLVRQQIERPVKIKIPDEAIVHADENSVVHVPFVQNDIEPMSKEQIKDRI